VKQKKERHLTKKYKAEVKNISKDIRSIISPLVVRRSRLDLQDIDEYADDLVQQNIQLSFPMTLRTYLRSQQSERFVSKYTLDRISKSKVSKD
jgi:hypothetical protein